MSDDVSSKPEFIFEDAFNLAITMIKSKLPVLLIGAPGCGKTALGRLVSQTLNWALMVAPPLVDSPIDYKGFPYTWLNPENGKQEAGFLPYGNQKKLLDPGGPLLFIADDLGTASPDTQAAFMQMLLNRSSNGIPIHEDVVFMACSNRKEDKDGSNGAETSLTVATRGTPQFVLDDWLDSDPYGLDAGHKGTCREILEREAALREAVKRTREYRHADQFQLFRRALNGSS